MQRGYLNVLAQRNQLMNVLFRKMVDVNIAADFHVIRLRRNSMGVYQVIFECERENNELVDQVHYVEAPDFESIAKEMIDYAKAYDHELKSIRYLFNVVQKIEKSD